MSARADAHLTAWEAATAEAKRQRARAERAEKALAIERQQRHVLAGRLNSAAIVSEAHGDAMLAERARAERLASALSAIGVIGGGYCFCYNSTRDPERAEHLHTGECRDARAALAAEEPPA